MISVCDSVNSTILWLSCIVDANVYAGAVSAFGATSYSIAQQHCDDECPQPVVPNPDDDIGELPEWEPYDDPW